MRLRVAAGAALLALAAAAMPSHAASTLLLFTDPEGDANFSGLHGGALPIPNQAGADLKTVTFDTVKKDGVATAIRVEITMASAPSTTPTSSYGIVAEHSVCGQMRLQIYYADAPQTYGDLLHCGEPDATGDDQFLIDFEPKVEGNILRFEVSLKSLPKEFKVGTSLSGISAYSANADPVIGYQTTDFESSSGIDTAVTDATWKIA